MSSLFEELTEKLNMDPRLTRRGGPRADLGLLLFNARESLNNLWRAADSISRLQDAAAMDDLHAAVEKLRPIFGDRNVS